MDDFDPEPITEAVEPEPITEAVEPEPIVLLDYLGEPNAEGQYLPGHKLATIVTGIEGGQPPRLFIRPGLNVPAASLWSHHEKAMGDSIKAGQIVKLEQLPRSIDDLLKLIRRTYCPDALQLIVEQEKKRGPRARSAIGEAVSARSEFLARRARRTRAS